MRVIALDPILLFDEHVEVLKKLEKLEHVHLYDISPKDNDEIVKRMNDADIVINYWVSLPREVIERLTRTKLIISAASGYNWIDYKAAGEKGILVAHCPGNNAEAVAEYSVGLILSSLRFIPQAVAEVKKGLFKPDEHKGKEIQGKTLGVIGYGSVGQRVAEIMQKGFGMKILYTNSKSTREDFEKLLRESDVISVNAPLNDHTKKIIGEKEFAMMKQGVVFVNAGRGGLLDEQALYKYLKSGHIFSAGLDVLEEEPFNHSNPLFSLPNVIITPHAAFDTRETDQRLSQQVIEIVHAFIEGKPKFIIPEHKDFLSKND